MRLEVFALVVAVLALIYGLVMTVVCGSLWRATQRLKRDNVRLAHDKRELGAALFGVNASVLRLRGDLEHGPYGSVRPRLQLSRN